MPFTVDRVRATLRGVFSSMGVVEPPDFDGVITVLAVAVQYVRAVDSIQQPPRMSSWRPHRLGSWRSLWARGATDALANDGVRREFNRILALACVDDCEQLLLKHGTLFFCLIVECVLCSVHVLARLTTPFAAAGMTPDLAVPLCADIPPLSYMPGWQHLQQTRNLKPRQLMGARIVKLAKSKPFITVEHSDHLFVACGCESCALYHGQTPTIATFSHALKGMFDALHEQRQRAGLLRPDDSLSTAHLKEDLRDWRLPAGDLPLAVLLGALPLRTAEFLFQSVGLEHTVRQRPWFACQVFDDPAPAVRSFFRQVRVLQAEVGNVQLMFDACMLASVVHNFQVITALFEDATARARLSDRAVTAASKHQLSVLHVYAVINILSALGSHKPTPLASLLETFLQSDGLMSSPLADFMRLFFGLGSTRAMQVRCAARC